MMSSQNNTAAPTAAADMPAGVAYATVPPETVVIPIVSSIVVFPAAALTIICCLRYRAQRARRNAKRPRLADKTDRSLPIIRIDGTNKHDLGVKDRWRGRGLEAKRMSQLHITSATVFQAVLGIDLDLDERSEWENDVMGYTSVRGLSSPTSSVGSTQLQQELHSEGRPRIIEMEMSPRAPRVARTQDAGVHQPRDWRVCGNLSVELWQKTKPTASESGRILQHNGKLAPHRQPNGELGPEPQGQLLVSEMNHRPQCQASEGNPRPSKYSQSTLECSVLAESERVSLCQVSLENTAPSPVDLQSRSSSAANQWESDPDGERPAEARHSRASDLLNCTVDSELCDELRYIDDISEAS